MTKLVRGPDGGGREARKKNEIFFQEQCKITPFGHKVTVSKNINFFSGIVFVDFVALILRAVYSTLWVLSGMIEYLLIWFITFLLVQ